MSEMVSTLIKSSFRVLGVTASGETPTDNEMADGLEALKFMLRHWSNSNIRIYCTSKDTLTLNGSTYYTIGSGGNCDTIRPDAIRGGTIGDASGASTPLTLIGEAHYRDIMIKGMAGTAYYLWYNPDYPLGKLYFWPLGSGTAYLDSLKPLTELVSLLQSVEFPPPYDEAIKWNLAVRLAPEFGKQPSTIVLGLAKSSLSLIESQNFATQMDAVDLNRELGGLSHYDIDAG